MTTENKPSKQHQRTFADNWANRNAEMLQLLLSAKIWEKKGFQPEEEVDLQKQVRQPQEDLVHTVFFLDDDPILVISKSQGTQKGIPLHETIFI